MAETTNRPGESREKKDSCACPYCEASAEELYPFCTACGAGLRPCPSCQSPVGKSVTKCPHCGAEIR